MEDSAAQFGEEDGEDEQQDGQSTDPLGPQDRQGRQDREADDRGPLTMKVQARSSR